MKLGTGDLKEIRCSRRRLFPADIRFDQRSLTLSVAEHVVDTAAGESTVVFHPPLPSESGKKVCLIEHLIQEHP